MKYKYIMKAVIIIMTAIWCLPTFSGQEKSIIEMSTSNLVSHTLEESLNNRLHIFNQIIPDPSNRVVWGRADGTKENTPSDLWAELNIEYWKEYKSDENIDSNKLTKLMTIIFGSPQIADISLDEYNGNFTIKIDLPNQTSYVGSFAYEGKKTGYKKWMLKKSSPWIIFKKHGTRITPVAVVLESRDKKGRTYLDVAKIDIGKNMTVSFSKDAAMKIIEERELEQKKNAKLKAERIKKERESWPKDAVGKLDHGATVCTNMKSMYKAIAIERAGNPYVPTPDDCLDISTTKYLTEISHLGNGITKVLIKGASLRAFVSTYYVSQ